MLLVNVHELEVVLADAVVVAALKDEVEHVGGVLGLEGQDVLVLGGAQHLGQRRQVDTQRNVAVAAVGREALGLEHHGHERDVRVVHGLQGNARVIAVEVAVLDQVLDGVDDLVRETRGVSTRATRDGGGRVGAEPAVVNVPSSGHWPAQDVLPT